MRLAAIASLAAVFFERRLTILYYPDVAKLKRTIPKKPLSWNIVKMNGGPRAETEDSPVFGNLSRRSPLYVKAVIISEDDKFWKHEGFDFEAMQQALDKNLKKGRFKYDAQHHQSAACRFSISAPFQKSHSQVEGSGPDLED